MPIHATSTGTDSLSARQLIILRVLVARYLDTGLPVASREVVRSGNLPFSSATVRAEFIALTALGFLAKPHAAAGRLPTEAAVRLYARGLLGAAELSLADRVQIDTALSAIKDELEGLLRETSQLLWEQTACVGVVIPPTTQWGHIEEIRLVPVAHDNLLVALLFAWGHVESRIMALPVDSSKLDLPMLERFVNQELGGKNLYELDPARLERAFALAKLRSLAHRAVFEPIEKFVSDLAATLASKVVSTGIVPVAMHPAFEGQAQLRTLLRLSQDPSFSPQVFLDMDPSTRGVRVRIGADLGGEEFAGLAMVWAPFGRTAGGGKVGIFGPVRMPYERAIPLVSYCADLLERTFPAPSPLVN
ncbi:MAG: heat-inducible transcriptional repressor HrcA [bacterium]